MANIELDGANKKIKVDSGDLTLDVPGDIILDADGGDVVVADGGTNILKVTNSSSDVVLQPQVDAKDIIFKQYDGTTVATVEDNGTFNIPANKLAIGGTAVTSTAAELNILDGVTATAAEINLIDGNTARGTTAISDGDGVLINDAGTMRMTNVTTLKTYAGLSGWSSSSGNLLPSDASKGIYLGVNSATASNLLTDYEEGEVSNALEIGTTQVTGYSSGRSNAMYVKIGKTVHMQFYLDTQGNTLPTTGQCFVRLPFAVRSSSTNCFPTGVAFGSGTNSATNPQGMKGEFYLNSGNTKTGITKYDDSTTFNANSTSDRIILQGAFTYQVD